jgi:hypothetical protein
MAFPAVARVVDVSVECPDKVIVGDPFVVEVNVTVDSGQPPQPEMPSPPGVTFSAQQGLKPRFDGRITQTFRFAGQIAKKGVYQITGIRAADIEAAPVKVIAIDAQDAAAQRKKNPPVFIESTIDKTEIWQGEQIVFSLYLYFQNSAPSQMSANLDEALKTFSAKNVTKETNEGGRAKQTIVDGARYNKGLLACYVISPLEPGEVTIPPIRLSGQMQVRSSGNDPFDGFFSFGRSVEIERVCGGPVLSQPIKVMVKPLPEEGRPQGFSGAVGQAFTFSADLPKREVAVGEPFSLSLRIKGSGNLDSMAEPARHLPDWIEVFDTERKAQNSFDSGQMSSEIKYDYVLIARKEGKIVLDPIPFSYFSTGDSKFVTLKQGPFTLQVNPDKGQAMTYLQGKRKRIRVTGEDFRHIRAGEDVRLSDEGPSVTDSMGFWTVLAGPWFLFLGVVAKRRREDYLLRNPRVSEKIKAKGTVKGHLAKAEKLLSNEGSQFHSELENAIHDLLTARVGISTRGLTRPQFREVLSSNDKGKGAKVKESRIDTALVDQIVVLLDELDQQRFAPGLANSTQRTALLSKVRDLLAEAGKR